jgi:RimJ/RimL family protein N-acetyltransferase
MTSAAFPTLRGRYIELRPLTPEHLERLRTWRNAAREWFFDSRFISPEQQEQWYHRVYLNDPGDYLWIAHLGGKPFGTGSLTHVDLKARQGEWARLIVGEDWARGQGLAHLIAALVRDFGLDVLKLERIYGSLWSHNTITLSIDMKAGYLPVYEHDGIIDVELNRKDWRTDDH